MGRGDGTAVDRKSAVEAEVGITVGTGVGSPAFIVGSSVLTVVGAGDGITVETGVGSPDGWGMGAAEISAMARLRMLASAEACQGSDAYTCTEGHAICSGTGKPIVCVGAFKPPETDIVIIKLVLSVVMVTELH